MIDINKKQLYCVVMFDDYVVEHSIVTGCGDTVNWVAYIAYKEFVDERICRDLVKSS